MIDVINLEYYSRMSVLTFNDGSDNKIRHNQQNDYKNAPTICSLRKNVAFFNIYNSCILAFTIIILTKKLKIVKQIANRTANTRNFVVLRNSVKQK